ncbi:hypothetical protein C1280_29720 [Gemmata obscuriglobus]|uniref:Uncharacterized protein n=1 Tax=Gemmata obscuriglobus TaxID=114 RepID=A0A2Z3HG20_9BACT|nr:hypothetical protein C1280_29720 [Gemmata obscuriglobus]
MRFGKAPAGSRPRFAPPLNRSRERTPFARSGTHSRRSGVRVGRKNKFGSPARGWGPAARERSRATRRAGSGFKMCAGSLIMPAPNGSFFFAVEGITLL